MSGEEPSAKSPGGGRKRRRQRKRRLLGGRARREAAMVPSNWRMQHHPLDGDWDGDGPALARVELAGENGGPASYPMRAADTVQALLNKGRIDQRAGAAARKFEEIFHRASLEGVASRDIRQTPGDGTPGGPEPHRILSARDEVWEAIRALGGIGSPGANVVWDVLGLGMTIKGHAERCQFGGGRSLNPMTATGILVQACFTLAALFGT